jgi:hypothetical protein
MTIDQMLTCFDSMLLVACIGGSLGCAGWWIARKI